MPSPALGFYKNKMTDPDTPPNISDAELEELEREAPQLSRLRRFSLSLDRIPWFNALGEPLDADARQLAESYLDALGFPGVDIAILVNWEDAADAAETLDWANPAWEAEELARADLTIRAMELMSEDALQVGLAVVAQKAGEVAKATMEQEAAIWDVADDAARNLAVGGAVQACHNAALALLVSASDPDFEAENHLFARKLALFELGRWPVGVAGSSFNLF